MQQLKRFTAIIIMLLMSVMLVCGCSKPSEGDNEAQPDSAPEASESAETEDNTDSDSSEPAETRYLPVRADFYDYDPDNTKKFPSAEEIHCYYEYKYDEHGNLVSCLKHEEASDMTDTYENTYRDDGTLEKVQAKIARDPYEDGEIVYEEYLFDFDENGKIINKPDDENSGEVASVKYTDDGLMTHIEYKEASDGMDHWDYDYEISDGGQVSKVMKRYDYDEYYVYVFTYDKDNKNTEVPADKYAEFINEIWSALSAW